MSRPSPGHLARRVRRQILGSNPADGIISWIIRSVIAGYIAFRLTGQRGLGFVMNTVLGVVAAVVGGDVMIQPGWQELTGLNMTGAIIVLALVRIALG